MSGKAFPVRRLEPECVEYEGQTYDLLPPLVEHTKDFMPEFARVAAEATEMASGKSKQKPEEVMQAAQDISALKVKALEICMREYNFDGVSEQEKSETFNLLADTPVGEKAVQLCGVRQLEKLALLGKSQKTPHGGGGKPTKSQTRKARR